MSDVIVGIGCDTEQTLAAEVLTFSIRSTCGGSPRIEKLHELASWADMAESMKGRQRTPFSFQRFLLAKLVVDSNATIGVYLDSDMLVLRSIDGLVSDYFATGAAIATVEPLGEWRRKPQSSVMVMNRQGAQLLWSSYSAYINNKLSYDELIYLKAVGPVSRVPYKWNCLEYLDENTALIHYTDMDTQPWLRDGNPNAGIWYTYLWRYATSKGGSELVHREIQAKNVRPGLRDVLVGGPSISAFSTSAMLADLWFVPPHRFRRLGRGPLRTLVAPILRALMALQFVLKGGQPNIR